MKKLNNRKCIVSHKTFPKEELIRIVKTKKNNFLVDSNEQGRGAYVQRDPNIFEEIKKKKLLNRAFKEDVPLKIYDELKEKLKEV